MSGGIAVAYSGVHQAYQLALAAHELGRLDLFYCSLFAAEGKWGGVFARLFGSNSMINRRVDGLSSNKVRENPWPLLTHRMRSRLRPAEANDWTRANDRFDRWVARQLKRSKSEIFVGVETCAQRSFREAKRMGAICVLDCPQMHPAFIERVYREAGKDLGVSIPSTVDTPRMAARKSWEFQNADYLLVPSQVAKGSFVQAGFPEDKIIVTPLWADKDLWFPDARTPSRPDGPLRVLFVGGLSWRKGIPYLLEAARACGRDVQLTLVGSKTGELDSYLAKNSDLFKWIEPQNKSVLRRIYCDHDALVLPSLADTFGFVALEAMACGLPVIMSENCGAPAPHPSWRVPIMDSGAIARRLQRYAADRQALKQDGQKALEFAAQFTPERYRGQVKEIYSRLLREKARQTAC